MDRAALLACLRTIEPALATRDLIPALTMACFRAKSVVAFDDVLAIRAPCFAGFEGSFPGRVLIDCLSAAGAREVEVVEQSATELKLKVGRSTLVLPCAAGEFPLFGTGDEPRLKEAQLVPIVDGFVDALQRAAVAVGLDSLQLWSYGVTLALGKKRSRLLATNNFSVCAAAVDVKGSEAVILPPRFVETLLRQARSDKPAELCLWEGWVGARFESGVVLYCRTVPEADVAKFDEFLAAMGSANGACALPKALEGSLNRAKVFLTSPIVAERSATFRVSKEKLYIEVESDRGSMRDVHKFPGHEETALKAPPELLLAGLPYAERIAILPGKAVRLEGDGFEYVVSGAL